MEHHGHRFLILHNDGAEDFALSYTSVDAPGEWTPLVEHQPGTRLLAVDAFSRYLVVSLRRDGLTGLRIHDRLCCLGVHAVQIEEADLVDWACIRACSDELARAQRRVFRRRQAQASEPVGDLACGCFADRDGLRQMIEIRGGKIA